MPAEILTTSLEKLWFDASVALKGIMADRRAEREAEVNGPVSTRSQAEAMAEIARREVEEMERAAKGRK